VSQPGGAQALFDAYHAEVVGVLSALGNPARGAAVRRDRGSELHYLGASFPDVRKAVRRGFSFSTLPPAEVLAVWDALWQSSPYGEVLFAALDYCSPLARQGTGAALWPAVRGWVGRVDNWAHADGLASVYSHLLEHQRDEVFPQLRAWNADVDLWPRRISLVSLIHYSGKNAVFLSPADVLPLVSICLGDHRYYIELAVGWVLREMGHVYPAEITAYLEANAAAMSAPAFSRAIERRAVDERARFRAHRKSLLAASR
jgi:3-methyladenine DNA glycosylase AlkD